MKTSKIRKSAKGEDCTLRVSPNCQDGEVVVFCHINSPTKGVGRKSIDLFGCYGCYHCHQMLDSSKVDSDDVLRAMIETQIKLVNKGLVSYEGI